MDAGQTTVTIGEHTTLGPVRIELSQPSPHKPAPAPTPAIALDLLLSEVASLHETVRLIHQHLTRPPWWMRLYLWIKNYVARSR